MVDVAAGLVGETDIDLAFRALGDANRRVVLALVRDGARPVGEVATEARLSQQATSHHLRVLLDAGLVDRTREGTRHLYAVRTDALVAVRGYLDGFWPTKLDALKRAVERSVEVDG